MVFLVQPMGVTRKASKRSYSIHENPQTGRTESWMGMSRNGQPYISGKDLPLCLVCQKPFTKGQIVVASIPEMIFLHLDCVEGDQDKARELMEKHRETGGK